MTMLIRYFIGCLFLCMVSYVEAAETNPIPRIGVEASKAYEVKINDQQVFTAHEPCFGDTIFATSICEINGKSKIEVTFKEGIKSYRIRPASKNLTGEINGKSLLFEVEKPQMLVVEINEEVPLLVALMPISKKAPEPSDPNVMYYAPGIHEAGVIRPKSGQTIYLAPGALVKGRIYAENADNVKVLGRGILDARGYTSKPEKICAIEFKNCNNIKVDGIGLRAGEWWQTLFLLCNKVEVSWMNLLSFGVNNDGIDIDGVTDFYAHNCFIGCGDDGFGWHALDAEANGEPPTQNCLADDCVIYNVHAGNGLRVGASMETELFKNITFRNIDVLEHANAGIRSDHSDWAMCENITFENFYMEKPGRPIEVKIEKTKYSNATGYKDERGQMLNWKFINVQSPSGEIQLAGVDKNHAIKKVLFKDCRIGCKPLSADSIIKNEFVYDVEIKNKGK